MFVCLLMQISQADYSAYLHELRVSCTLWLSLDLLLDDFWISSHYSLTVYHLYIWTNAVNSVLINSTHSLLKCVVFLFFTLPSWCQMSWWTFCFMLTHNTELSIYQDISLYKKLSTLQNLKQSLGEIPGEDCRLLSTIRCEWWNRAAGFAIPGSVFDPLLAMICF